jgi:hypothetical protein
VANKEDFFKLLAMDAGFQGVYVDFFPREHMELFRDVAPKPLPVARHKKNSCDSTQRRPLN